MVQTQIQGGDTRISQLPVASNLAAADLFVIVQSGQTKNLTALQLANLIMSVGPVTIIGGTINNVTIGNTTPGAGTFTSLSAASLSGAAFAAGIAAFLATPSSANLATAVTDETGTGALVFATNPVLVTPNIGTPSAGVLTNATGYPVARDIHAAVSKNPLVLADEFGIWDSVSGTLQKSTWGNMLSQLQLGFTYADATGTADAITATYTVPGFTALTDGFDVTLGIVTPNATNAPTFAPTINGLAQTAHTIVKFVNNVAVSLAIGDLQGDVWLVYDLPNTRWVLQNPNATYVGTIPIAAAGGTADAITATYNTVGSTLTDGFQLIVKLTASNATATPTFAPTMNGVLQTARTIVRMYSNSASALSPGDLQGDVLLRYDLANTRWIVVNPATNAFMPTSFKNLKIVASGLTNTSAVLTADKVILEDAAGSYIGVEALNLTINSAASGANGLDTGTSAASTWYSVWVIYNPTTATTAGLLSASATAPTMPTGYTFKARMGWVRTDGTANKYLLQTLQDGRWTQYVVLGSSNVPNLPAMSTGVQGNPSTPTWVAVAVGTFVPSTASKISVIGINTNGAVMVAPNNAYGAFNSTTNPPPLAMNGTQVMSIPLEMTLESANIYFASSVAAGGVFAFGWEDNI